MARVRAGSRLAFRDIYERHHARVYAYLWRMLQDEAAAEDLRQEAFIRLWHATEDWRDHGNVAGFLIRVARNLALNAQRSSRVRRQWSTATVSEGEAAARPPDEMLDQEAFRVRVEQAIEALPERAREVFILKRDAGQSYKEIATLLSISPKTVEAHMAAAYRLLRQQLADLIEE